MKHVTLAAIAICSLATACSIKNERTVVAAPPAATPTTVVYSDPAPTTTTVYTTPSTASTPTVYR